MEAVLRIYLMLQWFTLSDPAMEEALYGTPPYSELAGLDIGVEHLPDKSTVLRFRHLREAHSLAAKIFAIVG